MDNILTQETIDKLCDALTAYCDKFGAERLEFRCNDALAANNILHYCIKTEEAGQELLALFLAFDGEGVYQFVRKNESLPPIFPQNDSDSADWWKA